MSDTNGAWNARDPRLRLLRTIAFIVILALFAIVVLDTDARDMATLGTLAGMLLVFGGFEAGIRWPEFTGRTDRKEPAYTDPPTAPTTPEAGEEEWDSP